MTRRMIMMVTWLLAGCAVAPASNQVPGLAASADGSPDYLVDPRIAGKYGVTGEVMWNLQPGQRPAIILLGAQAVTFKAGTPRSRVEAYCQAVGARLVSQQVLPGTPDGRIPAKATDTYQIEYLPVAGSIADLGTLAFNAIGMPTRPVFSSETAARIFYAWLKARASMSAFDIEFQSLNSMGCIPEDCGVAPDDPYASATPYEPPAQGGYTSPAPPSLGVVEGHDVMRLPGRQGLTYVKGTTLYLRAPGQPAQAIANWDDRATFVLADPALRFVLLRELGPEPTELPVDLKPGDIKPHAEARLLIKPIGPGETRLLIDHIQDPSVDAALAPDGKTLAVRAGLTERERRLYWLNVEEPAPTLHPWLGDVGVHRFKWAPQGLTLAFTASPDGKGLDGLYVASPTDDASARLAYQPAGGLGTFYWLPRGDRLLTVWATKKYDTAMHLAVAAPGGEPVVKDLSFTGAEAYYEPLGLSPDGTQLLVRSSASLSGKLVDWAIDWEAGQARPLAVDGRVTPTWSDDNRPVCGDPLDPDPPACSGPS